MDPTTVSRGDRHIVHEGTPMANLWMSAAHKFDAPLERFGNSTGPLDI